MARVKTQRFWPVNVAQNGRFFQDTDLWNQCAVSEWLIGPGHKDMGPETVLRHKLEHSAGWMRQRYKTGTQQIGAM